MLCRFSRKVFFNLKCPINSFGFLNKFQVNKISTQLYSSNTTNTNDTQILTIDQNVEKYLKNLCNEYETLRLQQNDTTTSANKSIKYQRINLLENIINVYNCWKQIGANLNAIQMEIDMEKDKEMLKMLDDEKLKYTNALSTNEQELIEALYTMTDEEDCYSSLILEVNAGVGGKEAMLFASELHDMYCNYIQFKRWDTETIQFDTTELGGIRQSSQIVTGSDAYDFLKYEAGVHRVQRIPATEKSGRVHTSTVSVAVIPRPDDMDITINSRDLKIETKRASGAGGQHVNTTDSAVRIVHLPTNVAVECQTERSQIKNKELAMKKLQAKLLQQQMDADFASKLATRKSQIGRRFRNEKIRTYNYNQDRVTDHRIDDGTLHNLNGFLSGTDNSLDNLIRKIRQSFRQQELLEIMQQQQQQEKTKN